MKEFDDDYLGDETLESDGDREPADAQGLQPRRAAWDAPAPLPNAGDLIKQFIRNGFSADAALDRYNELMRARGLEGVRQGGHATSQQQAEINKADEILSRTHISVREKP